MPPINLGPVKKFVEAQMTDTVVINDDPEGFTDNVWDPVTGQYTSAAGDSLPIYTGKGFVAPLNVFPSQDLEGGATTIATDFELYIPLESIKVPVDSWVLVTGSLRNAGLVGCTYQVRSNQDNSFSVAQVLRMFAKDQRILH